MPILAAMIKAGLVNLYLLVVALKSARYAALFSIMTFMAGLYVACVIAWSVYIFPLLGQLFATAFGFVLGLIFPPIAGSILAGFVGLWSCVVAKNYWIKVIKVGAQ